MTTWIVKLWISGRDPYTEPPDEIHGPYTEAMAKVIVADLTCEYSVERIGTAIPEWATT